MRILFWKDLLCKGTAFPVSPAWREYLGSQAYREYGGSVGEEQKTEGGRRELPKDVSAGSSVWHEVWQAAECFAEADPSRISGIAQEDSGRETVKHSEIPLF